MNDLRWCTRVAQTPMPAPTYTAAGLRGWGWLVVNPFIPLQPQFSYLHLSHEHRKSARRRTDKKFSLISFQGFEALVCFWGLTDSTYAGLFSRLLLLRVVPEQHQNQSFIADTGNNKRAERTGSEKKIETAQAHRNRWLAFNV